MWRQQCELNTLTCFTASYTCCRRRDESNIPWPAALIKGVGFPNWRKAIISLHRRKRAMPNACLVVSPTPSLTLHGAF